MLVSGIVLNNTNFGTVKTVIGWSPNRISITTKPLYLLTDDLARSFESDNKVRTAHTTRASKEKRKSKNNLEKAQYKKKNKVKKCIYKLFHGKKKKHKFCKFKKIIIPILFGLILLKGLIASIVLKTLIFIAFKGLAIGFFSTIIRSILGLKGMFHHGVGHHYRKNDKIQEILRIPKYNNNNIYHKNPYKRKKKN